jgi:phytoene dehydrogenase-like protein
VQNIRFKGSTATVHLALKALPDFGLPAEALTGYLAFTRGLEHLERAYDDAKYRRLPADPGLLVQIPSLLEPGFAPEGRHVLSAVVRYAPYQLDGTNWDAEKAKLEEAVIRSLASYAPELPGLVEGQASLTPLDYERQYSLREGSWMHGQLALDQLLFMRPIPGWPGHRTPIESLYLCGSGSHPGGGVSGAPGRIAAAEVLRNF